MNEGDHEPKNATVRAGVTVQAAGNPPKSICEYAGRLSTGDEDFSVALMRSPAGWTEPPQAPEFREITAVIEGRVLVHLPGRSIEVRAGESIDVAPGEPVRYETPEPAVYVAVCVPAFSASLVHREEATPWPTDRAAGR